VVLGASGPLGRAVAGELRAAGHDVTAASRSGTAGGQQLDATDGDGVRRMLESTRPEALVYLARPDLGDGDSDTTVDRAVDAFRSFIESCVEHGVQRLLFASSAAVYGTAERAPRGEGASVDASSSYAHLKLRFEAVLHDVSSTAGLAGASLRIFNVYGPGFDSSLVNRLVTDSQPPPVVYNTDSFVRDYIHGADVARFFRHAVETDGLPTPVVNVGTGVGTSNRALLALLGRSTDAADPRDTIASFSVADPTVLRNAWGFAPAIDLGSAVRRAELFAA
jgi:UDP-glucose 4-epimerase